MTARKLGRTFASLGFLCTMLFAGVAAADRPDVIHNSSTRTTIMMYENSIAPFDNFQVDRDSNFLELRAEDVTANVTRSCTVSSTNANFDRMAAALDAFLTAKVERYRPSLIFNHSSGTCTSIQVDITK